MKHLRFPLPISNKGFMHSTHVQSMADIDSNMNKWAQARVHKHIQVMGGLISFHAALFSTCLWIIRVVAVYARTQN